MDTRNPEIENSTLPSCPALDIKWEDPYGGDFCSAVAQLQDMVLALLNKSVGIAQANTGQSKDS